MSAIRLVIADDHPVVRAGICAELEQSGFEVVAQAANGREAIEMVRRHRPDILILDIMMPEMNGTEVLALLEQEPEPGMRVIALSALNNEAHMAAVMGAGAQGYILKEEAPETIAQAVEVVMRGLPWISPRLVAQFSRLVARGGAYDLELSRRERQILCLIARGMSNQEIGDSLSIAEQTVKNHVTNLYTKIGVNSRVSAAIRAISLGLITLDEIEQNR